MVQMNLLQNGSRLTYRENKFKGYQGKGWERDKIEVWD